jgi:flavin reductase (DIM6/NTAB) family NADH-FMN oxidoreductase RutF
MAKGKGSPMNAETPAAMLDALQSSVHWPMAVVTTSARAEPAGCLVGFWTPASIDPPRCVVFLSKLNRTYEVARRGTVLVVHPLRRSDEAIAQHFGELTGDRTDKFADVEWVPGVDGAPVIAGLDWFAGRIRTEFAAGDHTGFLLDFVAGAGSFARAGQEVFATSAATSFEAGHPA